MSEDTDSQTSNLCLTEDAFDQFQAVSMYQEEEYITLPTKVSAQPKEPDRGKLSHNDNEVAIDVGTENEVNSTVNDNTEEMKSKTDQNTLDDSYLDVAESNDGITKDLDSDYEPQKVIRKGRKPKHLTKKNAELVPNNCTVLDSKEGNVSQETTDLESSLISSSVPRRRGRKPKPKPVPPESNIQSGNNQDSLNISSSRLSSDPETSHTVPSVKKKRGRPRKVSLQIDQTNSNPILSNEDSSIQIVSPPKRGRPRKTHTETNVSTVKNNTANLSNDLISLEELNGTQPSNTHEKSKDLLELDISKIENRDLDKKIFSDSDHDDLDDITLSKLKTQPETSKVADENNLTENDEDQSLTFSPENLKVYPSPSKKRNLSKKRKDKPKKASRDIAGKDQVDTLDKTDSMAVSSANNNETCVDISNVESDDNEDLSLSQLKEIKSDLANNEKNNTNLVSTTDDQDLDVTDEAVESSNNINKTPTKRNSKMPVMSDFEYNVDSVIENQDKESNADNALLVVDTSKRPIRKKVPKLHYDENSDEDPFANVELSDDDDEPRRRGKKYYSDDEYVPGRRGNKDIDSTDSDISVGGLVHSTGNQKRKKLRKRSDNQSPQKKAKVDQTIQDVESDDVEVCSDSSAVPPPHSKQWGVNNEFENFIAKKIKGTNLEIKKVSSTTSTESKALEIPVLDPEAKRTFEMCSQTTTIPTVSTGVQTTTPYDIPMKENIALTAEQSEKACYFLNSIVKTTSELGTLMTQKSEDFIKKKINTAHVTDTMKMDYCVKKSFLLFKLAKHNLMQMEEDLAKQYDDFLKTNNLTKCRELPKQIERTPKQASSDSDCEIVEEPVITTSTSKSKEKPKFNPKTVFLNKELSIKIAKKPSELNKKLNIKGRHTVWINDTVMVKKVKPTQSFLAQDSRNKKPPDNKITTKMVSDFFKNYYRQKAISVCAPFISTDWLNVSRECVCNYFVVKAIEYSNDVNYSANGGISTENNASTSERNNAVNQMPNKTIVTCPDTLSNLCLRFVINEAYDKRHAQDVCHEHIQNELTDEKYQPDTLIQQCLRVLSGSPVNTMERSPKITTHIDVTTVPPLKMLCHQKMLAIIFKSNETDASEEQEVAITRCSTAESNYSVSTCSSRCSSPSIKINNEIKSLVSLCVEVLQQPQQIIEVEELSNINRFFNPKSLRDSAFEQVQQSMCMNIFSIESSLFNVNDHNDESMIEGLTINSVNTLSEEAFLNLEQSHASNPDSPDYLDDFDNEDHCEPDFNETEEENQTEPETSWVSQVQMAELRSCFNTTSSEINQEGIISVKLEPMDDLPENLDTVNVKMEPIHGPDEMTIIPEVKPEVLDVLVSAPIQRHNSNSYDVDVFEQFAATNKIMHELQSEDIFSQSAHRVRRQHEPDYEEDDMSMSLLVPQTYEPLTIETAKGSLMESSSSDNDSCKNKKATGKKKTEKRKVKQKKADPKTIIKETPTQATKDKPTTNEVANLTRKMKDRIRQEEKKDDSTDSEAENLPLRLRSRKEQEKPKPVQTSKAKESEIQCNNVDSTDQVDDDVGTFTGFTAIDQNEITNYQKYMQYVYDKIIPDKEDDTANVTKKAEMKEESLISNEPVELLECEPTMPIFDEAVGTKRLTRKSKGKVETAKKEDIAKKEEISKKGITIKKEEVLKERVLEGTPAFVDRHGWHCYPVNGADAKLYQSSCVALEKLPESFVQTYFEYQGITSKNVDDHEIDRLTNLNSLKRTIQLNLNKSKLKIKREAKGAHTSEAGSRPGSPTNSDHYDELEPSDDDGANVDDEVAPPVPLKHTENTLAKNLLMNDNDSDSDGTGVKVKKEPSDGTEPKNKLSSKSKKKEEALEADGADLMLTADKMMNKELNLLHAPVVVTNDIQDTPSKGPVTRNKKSASKNQPSGSKAKNEEDSSSEEEKQWVTTKEKLLKRMGKKDQTSVDDAKRAKLVSEFIERRGDFPDSHIRPRTSRARRSAKKFLERQKQLGILSRELFGESPDAYMTKRSQASLYKGRRNIRKVIDKKSLARSTVVANMEEFERKRRLNAKQSKLRELLGCEEGVNVLVINEEVCLEYDFEENRPVVTVHPFFTKVMKAHQYEGVKFMWDACFESLSELAAGRPGGGCILAHCMGLGKTLQVLALLHTVLTHPGVKMQRVLVCCPLSTVLNWVDEIHKWIGPVTNEIKVFELSKLKKTYERAYQLEDWYNGGGIFIIGYELFRSLSTLDPFLDEIRPTIVNKIRTALLDPGPDIIVCDEGHLLKNDCSVLAVAMSRVVTKRRIILTGTPMQNNLREYYCMVNFVKPNLLGTYSEYSNRFENPIMNGQHRDSREEDIKLMKARTHILHKVLEGCLQRQEASVLYPYLPKKFEYTVFITLTPCQWDLYKHYLHNYGKQAKQSILKDFHVLQKIWSHPQVLHNFQTKARDREDKNKIKAEKLEDDLATEDLEEIKPSVTDDLWWLEYLDGGKMLETLDSSNKFVVVFKILDECVALGDKVLIFSTSLFCLDALEYFLKKINKWSLGHEYYRLDGSVPAEVRQKWCREFNADNNYKTKLFLVSTRAGCLGLNMTAANRVIIMDTSWNPAHDIQSIFRVYRFGQKKDCYIYRLVAMGTMEQKIYERSVTKQAVACRVVDEQQIDRHYNMAELTELYKFDEGGSCVAGGVAVGVHDVALLRVARDVLLHAVHEHDSLLRGSSEQGLPEHERNAAWMQFQQEQAHKQMENKLIVNIPTVAVKRIRDNAPSKSAPSTVVKTEDASDENAPNEPKTKKGKKSSIIPVQENEEKKDFKSRSSKEPPVVRPGTSNQQIDNPALISPIDQKVLNTINREEIMVEKITDILLRYNFQSKKGNPDIANLVKKVRNMVRKGYVNEEDMSDDLTASIAKVLLPQQMSLPTVTNIMCESINNSAEPNAVPSDADPEWITSDPTPELRTKRKAAIAAERNIDSLAQDVIVNLDDDDFDARDTDFVPGDNEDMASVKGKKKSKNLNSSKVVETDESTLSADETRTEKTKDSFFTADTKPSITNEIKDISTPKRMFGPKKPKDRLKTYSRSQKNVRASSPITETPTTSVIDNSSILLSDDEGPMLTVTTRTKLIDSSPQKVLEKPVSKVAEDEIVPLPMSLLKNQNFINIVAHTYLVGNPMLDEDAATLAAQYSTLRAYKEAEQTGQLVCSGPIYDIAVKIIGKEVLKKMHSANPKAAATSANDAAASIQMKEQMIQTQRTFEETAKISKAKCAKLREDMIEQKFAMNKAKAAAKAATLATVVTPAASASNTVVPVGIIKTTAHIGARTALVKADRVEPCVECILPDDDDVIISDVRATPAAPASDPAPAPPPPPPPAVINKPVVLNNRLNKPKTRGLEAQQGFRVTVGNGNGTSVSTPKKITPSKIVIRPYLTSPVQIPQINKAPAAAPPAQATAPPPSLPPPSVPEQILPNDVTICLDSDDEESAAPAVPVTMSPATTTPAMIHQAPVPVSLTSAQNPGVKLPLPPLSNLQPALPKLQPALPKLQPATQTQPTIAQKLVLRQVISPNGAQSSQYVLIPTDQLPMPALSKISGIDPPATTHAHPQLVTFNSFKTAPGESILATKKPEVAPILNRAACKPGDILRISKTGAIEVISRTELNEPKAKPASSALDANHVIIQNPKPTTAKPTEESKKLSSPVPKFQPILPKPTRYETFDLTNISPQVTKPNPTAPKTYKPATVDLTNLTSAAIQTPVAKTPAAKPTPATTTSVDLTNITEVTVPNKTPTNKTQVNKSQKKKDAKKVRKISSSSSGSSSSSRAASPDNPLSILKDVVHIKAVDYPAEKTVLPRTEKSILPRTEKSVVPRTEKSVVLRTEKLKTSNISVQHIVSDAKNLKLTRVPKELVPKHIDEAVEKQLRKEALMKRITPLLTKNQPKTKEVQKNRGKNTISFDNLSSAHTSKLLKNTGAGKSTDKKGKSVLKPPETVDLTNILPSGTSIKPKSESKKRQSTSTVISSTTVKKKKSAPMTLKDFDLDDIDDIIELE